MEKKFWKKNSARFFFFLMLERNNIQNTIDIFDAEAFSKSYSRREETTREMSNSRLVSRIFSRIVRGETRNGSRYFRQDKTRKPLINSRCDEKLSRPVLTRLATTLLISLYCHRDTRVSTKSFCFFLFHCPYID